MNGCLAVHDVEAASERFAVDRDDLAISDFMQGRDPTEQTFLELRRFDRREDRIETIMRGNAVGQIEESRQPLSLRSAELGDRDEIIRPTDHRAHRNHHDVDQGINHLATTRVSEFGEVVLHASRLCFGHGTDSLRSR